MVDISTPIPSLPRSLITSSHHKACLVCRSVYIPFHKTDTGSLHSPSLFPSLLHCSSLFSLPLSSLPLCSLSFYTQCTGVSADAGSGQGWEVDYILPRQLFSLPRQLFSLTLSSLLPSALSLSLALFLHPCAGVSAVAGSG